MIGRIDDLARETAIAASDRLPDVSKRLQFATISAKDPDRAQMPVEIVFDEVTDEVTLAKFKPRDS